MPGFNILPNRVRSDFFLGQARHFCGTSFGVFFHDVQDPVPTERRTKTIQENVILLAAGFPSSQVGAESFAGCRPKRANPPLSSFSEDAHPEWFR